MPYVSKKLDILLPSIAIDCDDSDDLAGFKGVLDTQVPIYQLKKWRRVLYVDLGAAFSRWAANHGADPSSFDTPSDTTDYWVDPMRWGVDYIAGKHPPAPGASALAAHNELLAKAHHELAVLGYDYRNGGLYRRKRPLKPATDDYSLREAAIALNIREEEIWAAVKRGDLLSSMADKGRRRVNQHDLEDWVRRFWTKSLWSKMGSVAGQK